MTFLRELLMNPRLNGINRVHFYFGLVLIFSAPFLGKVPLIFFGEKLEVKAVRIVSHESVNIGSGLFLDLPKKYTLWEGELRNKQIVLFEGSRNMIYLRGECKTAYVDQNNLDKSFIVSFAGIYNNENSTISICMLTIWIALFLVYGDSGKEWLKLRKIQKWYMKILAFLSVVFLFWFLVIFPIWLCIKVGWPGIILFLILLFFVSFQIRETIEYLVFSEEELKARFIKRSIKKRKEVREVNAEIFKRRKRKNKRI